MSRASLLKSSVARRKKVCGAGRAGISKPRAAAFSNRAVRASKGRLDKTAQAALRISEIRYRRLFEAARDGVLLLDPATRKITDANPFMIEILGYTHEEFVGKELWEIGLLTDQAASRKMFQELRKNHFVRYEDLPLKSRTGRTREVEVVANLYEEDTHQVIQCNIRDITERKRADHELAAANDKISHHAVQLKETVMERTAELRETIEELEAFSYSVSHDMRAPLRAMRGFANILLKKYSAQLDAEGIKSLEKIDVAGGRMDALIQDVLTYTRVLRAEVKIEPVDLDALVRQVIDTYPQLQKGDAEIQIEGVLPHVLGAEASLAQCLSNLLTNAVKFVAPGTKPRVKIRAEAIANGEVSASQEPPGAKVQVSGNAPDPSHLTPHTLPYIRLWIEDNGIGIAPNDQVRIFKMFERVGRATAYEGTGMGLTIVRKAVERMGGQIGVESETGRGSRFWIQLKGANP